MGLKRILSLEETLRTEFQTVPIFNISAKMLSEGNFQNVLQEFESDIKTSPLIALRTKAPKLPKFIEKSLNDTVLKVTEKRFEGFKSDSISSLYQHEEVREVMANKYIQDSLAEGHSTREEFIANLFKGPVFQSYSEANDAPDNLLDFATSNMKWNLSSENGIDDCVVPGVSKPFIYLGSRNSNFPWHQEDCNLISVNYHCGGKPKIWWAVRNEDIEKVRKSFKYSSYSKQCSQFLRHKSFLLNPAFLKAKNIQVFEFIQRPGDIVITNGWHEGGNFGFNINIAVNCVIKGALWTQMLISKSQENMCLQDCKFIDKTENLWELRTKLLKCKKCQKAFRCDTGKKQHEEKCLGEIQYPLCPYCNKAVKWLKSHVRRLHKESIVPQVCTLCRTKFPSEEELQKHWTQKVKNKDTKCKFCYKNFRLFYKAMSHKCLYTG